MRLDRDPQQGNGDETPEAASHIMRHKPCLGHIPWQTVALGVAGALAATSSRPCRTLTGPSYIGRAFFCLRGPRTPLTNPSLISFVLSCPPVATTCPRRGRFI